MQDIGAHSKRGFSVYYAYSKIS